MIVYHVPRNDAVATLDPGSAEAPTRWVEHERPWTAWNHVRTTAALAAATSFALALL